MGYSGGFGDGGVEQRWWVSGILGLCDGGAGIEQRLVTVVLVG